MGHRLEKGRQMSIDPFTFEIIRHKFVRIIDEAVITLKHISGSSATTEGNDLLVGLYRKDGSLLMGTFGYLHALPGAGQACRHIIQEYSENPGIYEGDVFLLNDPYIAALHSSDTYVLSPIHYDGEQVAWSANFVHLRDIGAINPGGFAPDSREIYHEGIMCPGIKLVEKGTLRKDVWKTLLKMVRTPEIVALDLHSQIAANITARERMMELLEKYGRETVDTVAQGLIDQSESLLRQRLRELPDGTWKTRQYLETPERIFTVNLAMTKEADHLHYDFTGTSEQAPVGFNSTYWGTFGALFAPLFPLLGYDISWNDGILKPVTIHAPKGSLINCTRPAPNCLATISGIEIVNNVSLEAISKMFVASDTYRKEATAVWLGAHSPITVGGYREDQYVIEQVSDEFGGSGGARTFTDGIDFGGEIPNPLSRTPNIESEEAGLPILFLFRRFLQDSAGPGRFRGGMTAEYAFAPHKAGRGQVEVVLYGRGTEFTQCQGFSGGYPGSNCGYVLIQGIDGIDQLRNRDLPERLDEMGGTHQSVCWGTFNLKEGEVVHAWIMGGGGYGDPLDRNPERVREDVLRGLVSPEWARKAYGVVLDGRIVVDLNTTQSLREEMVHQRLSGWEEHSSVSASEERATAGTGEAGDRKGYPLSENLRAIPSSHGPEIRCQRCNHCISRDGQPWKDHAVVIRSPLTRAGPARSPSGRFEMRLYLCPGCGRSLDAEVAKPGDPPLYDAILAPA